MGVAVTGPVASVAAAVPEDTGAIRVTIPDLRVKSPNGLLGAEHFRSRHHRRQYERRCVRRALAGRRVPPGPWLVVWTRVGSKLFDGDNCSTSFKSPVDEVSDWLGINDADPRVTWLYSQRVERVAASPQERVKDKGRHVWRSWVELVIVGNVAGRLGMKCDPSNAPAPSTCASRGWSETCAAGEKARRRATARAMKAGGYWGDGPA
jgi:hypothetical protein